MTARAAALQARANSVTRAVSSGASAAACSLTSAISQVGERIDVDRVGVDRLDDRPRVIAPYVSLPRVREHRLVQLLPPRVHEDLHLRPERIRRVLGRHHPDLLRVQSYQIADR